MTCGGEKEGLSRERKGAGINSRFACFTRWPWSLGEGAVNHQVSLGNRMATWLDHPDFHFLFSHHLQLCTKKIKNKNTGLGLETMMWKMTIFLDLCKKRKFYKKKKKILTRRPFFFYSTGCYMRPLFAEPLECGHVVDSFKGTIVHCD